MTRYHVTVQVHRLLTQTIVVEAETEAEARDKALDGESDTGDWEEGEIDYDYIDVIDVEEVSDVA